MIFPRSILNTKTLSGVFYFHLALVAAAPCAAQEPAFVADGFQLVSDAEGFMAPTGIAFLNHPGAEPSAPLYLVAELRGALKVVRRDRRVVTLAVAPRMFVPEKELPDISGEIGQIGLCIDSSDEHLITSSVTYAGHTRFNRLISWRSTSTPKWTTAELDQEQVNLFKKVPTHNPHQIGFCYIGSDQKIWVGTGDGAHHRTSHLVDFPNGKLLRFNLDFTAPSDNPFYNPQNPGAPEGFVYASGFRNPFAIAPTPWQSVYLADNGPNVDRLLEVHAGKDYPWDGKSNESLIYGNALTWPQSIGPAGMIYIKDGTPNLESLWGHLVIAASYSKELLAVPVKAKVGVTGPPLKLAALAKDVHGAFTGLALGPDGIYAAFLEFKATGGLVPSRIFKLMRRDHDEPNAASTAALDGARVFNELGCFGCHILGGQGSPVAPALDGIVEKLGLRLQDDAYLEQLRRAAAATTDLRIKSAAAQIAAKSGPATERIRLWLWSKLSAPDFENPQASMPKPEASEEQVEALADYLLAKGSLKNRPAVLEESFGERAKWFLHQNLLQLLPVVFILGLLSGWWLRRRGK